MSEYYSGSNKFPHPEAPVIHSITVHGGRALTIHYTIPDQEWFKFVEFIIDNKTSLLRHYVKYNSAMNVQTLVLDEWKPEISVGIAIVNAFGASASTYQTVSCPEPEKPQITQDSVSAQIIAKAFDAGWRAARGYREDMREIELEPLWMKARTDFMATLADVKFEEARAMSDRETFMHLMAEFLDSACTRNISKELIEHNFFNMFGFDPRSN